MSEPDPSDLCALPYRWAVNQELGFKKGPSTSLRLSPTSSSSAKSSLVSSRSPAPCPLLCTLSPNQRIGPEGGAYGT